MPYSIIVYDPKDESLKLNVEMHFGSGRLLMTYWTSPADKLGCTLIPDMVELAFEETGFILNGEELITFINEISELKEFWRLPDAHSHGLGAPDDLIEKFSTIQAIALQAYETGQTLAVC